MEQGHNRQDENLPEVNPECRLPEVKEENLPEVVPHVYPEVVQDHTIAGPKRGATICGLPKRRFWIAVAAAVLVVSIAVGVGVGLGVTRDSGSPSTHSIETGADGGGNSSKTPPTPGRIASFSRLTAENYTSLQDVEHAQVYFQDNALNIWMADLNTFTNQWSLRKVNTKGLNPKNGTALASFNWRAGTTTDFHIRLISATNNNIRSRFGRDRLRATGWQKAVGDNQWTATNNSNIGLYGRQCDQYCVVLEMMVFRSAPQRKTAFAYPSDLLKFNASLPSGIVADDDTAYALVNILAVEELGDTNPYTALYLSAQRALRELYFTPNVGWNATDLSLDLSIDPGAQIAAMSYARDGLRYGQVLITRAAGGVMMAYADGAPSNQWTCTGSVGGMEKVMPLSPISATQTGRVFALEQGADGPEMVQFVRTSETGMPTFERVGVVNATVDS